MGYPWLQGQNKYIHTAVKWVKPYNKTILIHIVQSFQTYNTSHSYDTLLVLIVHGQI